MNNAAGDVRIRRPQQHEALMRELHEDAGFPAFRDVLILAGAIGYHFSRRVSFTSSGGDPIRYEVLTYLAFTDTLINMIAATDSPEDAEIMDSPRLQDRVTIFEEYANGGLEYIQEQVNVRHQPSGDVVLELVTEAMHESSGAAPVPVEDLLEGVSWR